METIRRPRLQNRFVIAAFNVLGLLLAAPGCFILFILAAFSSDNTTGATTLMSGVLLAASVILAAATVTATIYSQVRRSYILALIPTVLSLLLYIWFFLL